MGLATPGTFKLLALTQNLALVISGLGRKRTHKDASQSHIRYLNLETTLQTDRLLIGRDKELLQSLVTETCLEQLQKAPRVTVN